MDLVSRNEAFQCLALTFVGNSEPPLLLLGAAARSCC
jgi:hypothetical protein